MRNATGLLRYRADRRPSRKSTSTTSRRPVRVGQRSPAAPAGLGHRGSPRTGASCSARTLRTPLFWKRSLSAGSHLDRRQAVGQRSEEHTSELQSQSNLVCRLLLEKKKDRPSPHHVLWANKKRYHG